MAKYTIDTARVIFTQAEIRALFDRIAPMDLFGEFRAGLAAYLTFETAQAMGLLKDGTTASQWGEPKGDVALREDMVHYRDWWRQKVENGRGISCFRGKVQFCIRMAIAGMPEWESVLDSDGGYYQEDAYNAVGALFGWEPVEGCRHC